MADFCRICIEMADELDRNHQCLMDDRMLTHPLADRARAALAEVESMPDDLRKVSAALIRNCIETAILDTAHVHFRVASGAEDGAQLVRCSDLMKWAEKTAREMESGHD